MSGAMVQGLVRASAGRQMAIYRMIGVLLVLVLSGQLLHAGQGKPRRHEARHEIDQLEEQWRIALLKGDTVALGSLLADDYIAITASGTLQTKDETLASMRARRMRFASLDLSDRKVRFYGSTALVNSLAQVKGVNAEGDVKGSFRYTRVYVRDGTGNWKIVSFEASRIRLPGERAFVDSVAGGK